MEQEKVYVEFNRQMADVIKFNRDILGIEKRNIGPQQEDEFKLSLHQMREELDELEEAYNKQDFIAVIDALIDLEYFLYGVFWKNGISEVVHSLLFKAVHDANMLKRMGVKKGREGYDAADATKPAEWVDPQIKIARILEAAGVDVK